MRYQATAVAASNQLRRSFYDALILASAETAGCNLLFSEDMNTGEAVAGVRIRNPFASQVD